MIFASTPATGSALNKGPGVYLAAGVGWGRAHAPNPMLLRFRESGRSPLDFLWLAGSPASTAVRYGVEESRHARRVLERLVRQSDGRAS